MAVRSRLFVLTRVQPATPQVVLYTVPTGRTMLLKELTISNNGAVTGTAQFVLRTPLLNDRIYLRQDVAPNFSYRASDLALVLHPGQALVVNNTGGGDLHISASGSLLFGAPE